MADNGNIDYIRFNYVPKLAKIDAGTWWVWYKWYITYNIATIWRLCYNVAVFSKDACFFLVRPYSGHPLVLLVDMT